MSPYRITIIGAGIIGLTNACTILREYAFVDDLQLRIVSERFSPETTGDVSAGYWEPYGFESIDERTLRWAGYTYEILLSEFFSTKAARAGIMEMAAYTLKGSTDGNEEQRTTQPEYSRLVRHFRMLDEHEIQMFDHLKPKFGFVMSTVTINVRCYLRELTRFLARNSRVKFIRKRIHSFEELINQTDLIINCSGLGSRELANDLTIRPARGQVITSNQSFSQ